MPFLYTPMFIASKVEPRTIRPDAYQMKFFNGFRLVGNVMKPHFEPIMEDGVCQANIYWDTEAAETALIELHNWFATEGVRWGDKAPEGLGIIEA